ncbi:MAG: hypothetical protein U0527_05310 [Candidatus Eisenbacteria bacterium]
MIARPAYAEVFCEGYHDRAFWKGLLLRLGFRDARERAHDSRSAPLFDPDGSRVDKGRFAFLSAGGSFLTVVPCGSKAQAIRSAKQRILGLATKPRAWVILSVDLDEQSEDELSDTFDGLARAAESIDRSTKRNPSAHEFELPTLGATFSLSAWSGASTEQLPGVPFRHTLERLICEAMVAAHADRGTVVNDWTAAVAQTNPSAVTEPKHYLWSYMAGWYSDFGCEGFLSHIWEEPEVATRLVKALGGSSFTPVLARLSSY